MRPPEMADPLLEHALLTGRQALGAITSGDMECFEASWASHEAACRALAGFPGNATAADQYALDELIALVAQVSIAVGTVVSETAQRITTLRRAGRTNAAYAASNRPA